VNRAAGERHAETKLMIELFLPINLLLRELDCIQIQLGFEQECLGVLYPLVVRPVELLYPDPRFNAIRKDWQHRWLEWKNGLHSVLWIQRSDENNTKQLLARLRAGNYTCVASTFAPRDLDVSAKICRCIIQAGVPIALFHRGGPNHSEKTRRTLVPFLEKSAIMALPTHVLRQRAEAQVQGADHVGQRLTLFWNNPHRCPPAAPFESP
jgi:hypothetical protein